MREILPQSQEQPVHPWNDKLVDLPEGKGNFYYWGPNYTVDPIVIRNSSTPSLLLIQRRDTGTWALPGGFVDPGENEEIAARRELIEETSISLVEQAPVQVYKGPVSDPRATKNAWPETTALMWRVDHTDEAVAGDDAQAAAWFPLTSLPPDLYGSHADLIERAIVEHGSLREQLAYFEGRTETVHPNGGHMGYERRIKSLPSGARVFMKKHDPTLFTDPVREQHSREYLKKEHAVYTQLASQVSHIPARFELHDGHTLALEAYDARDGWHWRAPRDERLQKQYISDVLNALKDIEQATFEEAGPIQSTHTSLRHEGWEDFALARDRILAKLQQSSLEGSDTLRAQLDTLNEQYQSLDRYNLTSFSHGDLRQSNLAWHPEQGVKIVDWSWAGPSVAHHDSTSFLIDLAKSGIDVSEYLDCFDETSALILIGFWANLGSLPPSRADSVVRDHQLASAIAAARLLERLRE